MSLHHSLIGVCGMDIKIEGKLIRTARLELDKYEFIDDPSVIIEKLRKAGTRIDIFTFLQRLAPTFETYNYPFEWDNLAVLEVSTFDHWWKEQIRSLSRNRARQAEKKGVTVREVEFDDELVHGIWEIYNEHPVRQGVRFVHYGRDIDWVRAHAATVPDSSIFIGAFFGGKLIGFIKLVTDQTRTQACMMHVVSMVRHKDKAPTNALIAHAVRSCAERGIRYLVYQNFLYGKKQEDGLSDFKRNNGFQKVDVPRYFVPITSLGMAALRLKLHQRFVDHLPVSLSTQLRAIRRAWYAKKSLSVRET